MDLSVAPGTDFARFASGTWVSSTPIPEQEAVVGLVQDAAARSRALMDRITSGGSGSRSPSDLQISDFTRRFLDVEAIDRAGMAPVAPLLRGIGAADRKQLAATLGAHHNESGLLALSIGTDPDQPDKAVAYVGLGNPVMPKALFEPSADPEKRAGLITYVAALLEAAGWPKARSLAPEILEIEASLAAFQWSEVDLRDRTKINSPTDPAALVTLAPGFPWSAYLDAAGLGEAARAIVIQKPAMPKVAALFAETDLAVLRAWTAFRLLDAGAPVLPKALRDARFAFRGKLLNNQQAPAPRERVARSNVSQLLGSAMAEEFARLTRAPEAEAAVRVIAEDLRAAMRQKLASADWLDERTRTEAMAKLSEMQFRIGAPRSYDAERLKFADEGSAYANQVSLHRLNWQARLSELESGDARDRWLQRPYVISAAAALEQNVVYVPLALLQPPFFQAEADPAVNYGAIGAVIGHEITHHFDDQGRKYDATGQLRDWWSSDASDGFVQRADFLGRHIDGLSFAGVQLEGRRMLSETIADIGGLDLAVTAFTVRYGRGEPTIEGLTPMQRLLLSWAQLQRNKARPDVDAEAARVISYLPGSQRAQEPLRHVEAWYDAFDIGPKDPLYLAPGARARIW